MRLDLRGRALHGIAARGKGACTGRAGVVVVVVLDVGIAARAVLAGGHGARWEGVGLPLEDGRIQPLDGRHTLRNGHGASGVREAQKHLTTPIVRVCCTRKKGGKRHGKCS